MEKRIRENWFKSRLAKQLSADFAELVLCFFLEEFKERAYCDHNWYTNAGETKRWCSKCDEIEKINFCNICDERNHFKQYKNI